MPSVADLLARLVGVTTQAVTSLFVLALVFTVLAAFARPCDRARPWWRKPDLSTDLCWALMPRLLYSLAQTAMLASGIGVFYGLADPSRFFAEGHGPLAGLGFWPQVGLYLLGADLVMYLTHRAFHGARLWRFHAVHHSSAHLDWISATRFHPVDQILHGVAADAAMLCWASRQWWSSG